MRLLIIIACGVVASACNSKPGTNTLQSHHAADSLPSAGNQPLVPTMPPTSKPSAEPAPTMAISSLDALKQPEPFSEAELMREATKLVRKNPGTDSTLVTWPEYGRPTIREDAQGDILSWYEARKIGKRSKAERPKGAGKPIRTFHRLIRNRPVASVGSDGLLTVRFKTVRKVTSATLYVGEMLRDDLIANPRFRKSTSRFVETASEGDAYAYAISYPLPKLHHWRYRTRGPQHDVVWRLVLFDQALSATRVRDGRVSVRCAPGPCGVFNDEGTLVSTYRRLPTFFANPVVDQVSDSSALVSFRTDTSTSVTVLVTDGLHTARFTSKTSTDSHELLIDALKPSTRYRYAVVLADAAGQVSSWPGATFVTAPIPGADTPVRLAVMSDSRSGAGSDEENYCNVNRRVLEGLMSNALRGGAQSILFVGDLVDGYTTEPEDFRYQLEGWVQVTAPFGAYVPIYEAIGNHEAVVAADSHGWRSPMSGAGSTESVFSDVFSNPTNGPVHSDASAPSLRENTYSADFGNVHFAVINSNYWVRSHPDDLDHPMGAKGSREGTVDPEVLDWLDKDLADARSRGQKHLLVATHEPMFPNGGHTKDGMWWFGKHEDMNAMRNRLIRLMSKHQVAAILHGDEHNYSRLIVRRGDTELFDAAEHPITQIITGGAGAPWYVQQTDLPWSKQVAKFDLRQHVVFVDADGDVLTATVQALTGETIETFTLSPLD